MSTRATFLTGATALVVIATGAGVGSFAVAADAPAPQKMTALGDWLRMLPDGTVEMYTDKVEVGMGVPTGFAQFVADELDVPFDRVRPMLGDTSETVSAGGVGGSFSTFAGNFADSQCGGRNAQHPRQRSGAAPRRTGLAAHRPRRRDPSCRRSRRNRCATPTSSARSRPIRNFRKPAMASPPASPCRPNRKTGPTTSIAGSPMPRKDAAPKAFGNYPYVVNVKPPGMVHGRFVYPPSIGATLVERRRIVDPRHRRLRARFASAASSASWRRTSGMRFAPSARSKRRGAPQQRTLPKQDALPDYMWSAALDQAERRRRAATSTRPSAAHRCKRRTSGPSNRTPTWARDARSSTSAATASRCGRERRRRTRCAKACRSCSRFRSSKCGSSGRPTPARTGAAVWKNPARRRRFSRAPSTGRCACNRCAPTTRNGATRHRRWPGA